MLEMEKEMVMFAVISVFCIFPADTLEVAKQKLCPSVSQSQQTDHKVEFGVASS